MLSHYFRFLSFTCVVLLTTQALFANQTATTTPILPQTSLPFSVSIEQLPFTLPSGIHSGASAIYHNKWLFIAGRTNGLHTFNPGNNNFPPSQQNTIVYVVDPATQTVYSRDLKDAASGLTQEQIDQLSVTSPQYYRVGSTLYLCGGYGVETATGLFSTKSVLTAIDLPGLMNWVIKGKVKDTAAKHIRQTTHPLLQVTGGSLAILNKHLTAQLIFGQNFIGYYNTNSNGEYTQQVRCFQIIDTGEKLYVQPRKSVAPNPDYRRRDLNVVPVILNKKEVYIALSGVFTLDGGIWTVPVLINEDGTSSMADPLDSLTFKQGMNNYASPTMTMYSRKTKDNYVVIFGGLSYGFFQGGVFQTDGEIPFINQITTVKIDKKKNFSQYLMNNEYPFIASTGSNPGNQLLFGAGAYFIYPEDVPSHGNGVFQFDKIKKPTTIGFIVGGIMSTLPNTNTGSDSTASPYIFRVTVTPL